MDRYTNSFSTPIIVIGLTLSFFIIIVSLIFLFFKKTRVLGITFLILYLIIGLSSGSYFGSKQFGIGFPIILFIIFLCIILWIVINIKDPSCAVIDDEDDTTQPTCLENFEGPSVNRDGQWCYRQGDYCTTSDGQTINLANQTVNKLKDQLKTVQNTCEEQKDALQKTIKCQEQNINTGITSGPCVTDDNKWGVILSQYGKKCVSSLIVKKETKNGKIQNGLPKEDKEDQSKLSQNEIKNRHKARLALMMANRIDREENGNIYDGQIDTAEDKEYNFENGCKKKYGSNYYAGKKTEIPCPLNDDTLCIKNKKYYAECYCKKRNER